MSTAIVLAPYQPIACFVLLTACVSLATRASATPNREAPALGRCQPLRQWSAKLVPLSIAAAALRILPTHPRKNLASVAVPVIARLIGWDICCFSRNEYSIGVAFMFIVRCASPGVHSSSPSYAFASRDNPFLLYLQGDSPSCYQFCLRLGRPLPKDGAPYPDLMAP